MKETEQLVSYETAVLAEKKGFDWPSREVYTCKKEIQTLNYYEGDGSGWVRNSEFFSDMIDDDVQVTAPSQSLLQKWLRNVQQKHIVITKVTGAMLDGRKVTEWTFTGSPWETLPTYEEALEAGLQNALKQLPDNGRR